MVLQVVGPVFLDSHLSHMWVEHLWQMGTIGIFDCIQFHTYVMVWILATLSRIYLSTYLSPWLLEHAGWWLFFLTYWMFSEGFIWYHINRIHLEEWENDQYIQCLVISSKVAMRLDKFSSEILCSKSLCQKATQWRGVCVCVHMYAHVCAPVCTCLPLHLGVGLWKYIGEWEKKGDKEGGKWKINLFRTLKDGCSSLLVIVRQEAHFLLLMNFNCNYRTLVSHINSQGLDQKYTICKRRKIKSKT